MSNAHCEASGLFGHPNPLRWIELSCDDIGQSLRIDKGQRYVVGSERVRHLFKLGFWPFRDVDDHPRRSGIAASGVPPPPGSLANCRFVLTRERVGGRSISAPVLL